MINSVWNKFIAKAHNKPTAIAILCVAGFVSYIAVHHMLTAIVGSATHSYAGIKIAKDLFVFLILAILVAFLALKNRLGEGLFSDKLNLLILAYIALHLIMFVPIFHIDIKAGIAGMIFNLRFFALYLLITMSLNYFDIRMNHILAWSVNVILIVATIVSLFAIIQVKIMPAGAMRALGYDGVNTISPTSTVDNNNNAQRAFSTMRGPNELGSYLILPICLGVVVFLKKKSKITLGALFVMFVALLLTYSRSALLGVIVAMLMIGVEEYGPHVSRRMKIITAVGAVVIAITLMAAAYIIPAARLAVFHSSTADSSLIEGSTGDHYAAVIEGINDVIAHPFGRGVGQAGPASFYDSTRHPRIAENYFIQIAQEVGVIGLILFVGICVLVCAYLIRINNAMALALAAAMLGLSINALFLHTWADEAVSYTWWGMAGVAIAGGLGHPGLARYMRRINNSPAKS